MLELNPSSIYEEHSSFLCYLNIKERTKTRQFNSFFILFKQTQKQKHAIPYLRSIEDLEAKLIINGLWFFSWCLDCIIKEAKGFVYV